MTERATAVVVVNYQSSHHVETLLASLESEPVGRVVVWDNGSSPDDAAALASILERHPHVEFVAHPTNIGFGPAANRAVASLQDDDDVGRVWILNPDTIVRPGALRRLEDTMVEHRLDLVSPLVLAPALPGMRERVWFRGGTIDRRAGRSVHTGIGDEWNPEGPGFSFSDFVSGAALMVRMDAWTTLGGFDERFFLYCEDADLSIRATKSGMRIGVDTTAIVEHLEGGSSSSGGGPSPTFYFYVQRNRLLLYREFTSAVNLVCGRGLGETLRMLVFPVTRSPRGRRAEALRSSMAGLRAGLQGASERRVDAPVGRGRTVTRVYRVARTAHLERLRTNDHLLLFQQRSYDFDASLAAEVGALQLSRIRTALYLRRRRPLVLELNEPLMVSAWLDIFLYSIATMGSRTRRVAYAIENADLTGAFQRKFRLPVPLAALVVRVVGRRSVRRFDRIAFGTKGAESAYREQLGTRVLDHVAWKTFEALEPPAVDLEISAKVPGRVIFLGAFERHKGFQKVLEAWPRVACECGDASLTLAGKGSLLPEARRLESTSPNVRVIEDPSRVEIRQLLTEASVLVLPSQPGTLWREQIGLPIVEGLSHGCRIVASDQTGLAGWLEDHGHRIVPHGGDGEVLGDAISSSIRAGLSVAEILTSLPSRSGRQEASRWLVGPAGTA